MDSPFGKASGYCLIIASLLMTLTMMLHPAGGDKDHILKVKSVIMVSHSIAIFCLPVIAFGFVGLAKSLQGSAKISYLALAFAIMGLMAALIAATINGLTLPLFLSGNFSEDTSLSMINTARAYGANINKPMSYVFIASIVLAIGIWSVLQIRKTNLSRWIGYYGLVLSGIAVMASFLQFNFVSLYGFTVFVVGFVGWILLSGITLLTARPTDISNSRYAQEVKG